MAERFQFLLPGLALSFPCAVYQTEQELPGLSPRRCVLQSLPCTLPDPIMPWQSPSRALGTQNLCQVGVRARCWEQDHHWQECSAHSPSHLCFQQTVLFRLFFSGPGGSIPKKFWTTFLSRCHFPANLMCCGRAGI